MSTDPKNINKIENLSSDIQSIINELRETVSKIKDPVFVGQAITWLDMFDEALLAVDESIENFSPEEELFLSEDENEDNDDYGFTNIDDFD